ncbi:MAG: hypothetical protein AABX37_00910 [Nanoarchaeota archaeon]
MAIGTVDKFSEPFREIIQSHVSLIDIIPLVWEFLKNLRARLQATAVSA